MRRASEVLAAACVGAVLVAGCGGDQSRGGGTLAPTKITFGSPARALVRQPPRSQLRLARRCLARHAEAPGRAADARTSDVKRGRLLRQEAQRAVLGYGDELARQKMVAAARIPSPGATVGSICSDLGQAFTEGARAPGIDVSVAGAEPEDNYYRLDSKSPTATIEVGFSEEPDLPQVRVLDAANDRPVGVATTDGLLVRVRVPLSGESPSFRVLARSRPGGVEARDDVTIFRPPGAVNASGGTVPAPPPTRRDNIRRLLEHKQAIGMERSALRAALGRPDQTQDVGGRVYWYYDTSANTYQVVMAGGRVEAVNRY